MNRKLLMSLLIIFVLAGALPCFAQSLKASSPAASQKTPLLHRQYLEGQKLAYHMKGANEDWRYEIQADASVKKDSAGLFVEEFTWSNLRSNRPGETLSPAVAAFRETLSLDPNYRLTVPDLSQVIQIVGPITDLLTFYPDWQLAAGQANLHNSGDHFYFKHGTPHSWADGSFVILGQDSIDFDIQLKSIDPSNQKATLVVLHVIPEHPQVQFPAEWMRAAVSDTPNNWVNVVKLGDTGYLAEGGKETFDVEMIVRLSDGRILSGTLDNTVISSRRQCSDAALTRCGDPSPHSIHRFIEISSLGAGH